MLADLCRIRDERNGLEAFGGISRRKRGKVRHVGIALRRLPVEGRVVAAAARENIGVNRRQALPVDTNSGWRLLRTVRFLLFVLTKAEQVHQVSDRWTIQRNVRVALAGYRIREIVPAASRHRSQSPVGLNEFKDRSVVGVGVRDSPGLVCGETTRVGIRVPSPK